MVQNKLPLINSTHGSETRNIINELIKLFNSMGYTYDEALNKAHDVLNEAQQINNTNVNVQQQINTMIAESGTSDAETLQARFDAEGNEYTVLKDRLDAKETEFSTELAQTMTNGNGKKSRVVFGVVRNEGDGFEIITTGGHTPFNIESVETLNDKLRINYSFTGKNTGTFLAVPDETLAKKGYIMGSSVASSYSDIMFKKIDDVSAYITKSGGESATFETNSSLSNGGIVSLEWSGPVSRRLVITHDKCYNPVGIGLKTRDNRVTTSIYSMDAGGEKTYIQFYGNYSFGSNIGFNGSAFKVSEYDGSENSEIKNLEWISSENRLRVNHIDLPDSNIFVDLVQKNTSLGTKPYEVVLRTISRDYFDVQFFDNNGDLVTTPNANCTFTFSRKSKSNQPITPPDGTVLLFNRYGSGVVPPADIDYPGSNIWLLGIMEDE